MTRERDFLADSSCSSLREASSWLVALENSNVSTRFGRMVLTRHGSRDDTGKLHGAYHEPPREASGRHAATRELNRSPPPRENGNMPTISLGERTHGIYMPWEKLHWQELRWHELSCRILVRSCLMRSCLVVIRPVRICLGGSLRIRRCRGRRCLGRSCLVRPLRCQELPCRELS